MRTKYINPYDFKRSEIIDDYEYGQLSTSEYCRMMNMVDTMEIHSIQPYSDREYRNFERDQYIVQPYKTMCTIVDKAVA